MAFSKRALANRHCRSRAVSMRARCAASSFSGSSFLRGAMISRSSAPDAEADDPLPAPASSTVPVLRRRLVVGSQGPLAAAAPGSGSDRRCGDIGSASVDAALLMMLPLLLPFSLLLRARRGGSASAPEGGFLWAKEAALRRERVKFAVDVDRGVARMPSYTKAPEPAREDTVAVHGRREDADVLGRREDADVQGRCEDVGVPPPLPRP